MSSLNGVLIEQFKLRTAPKVKAAGFPGENAVSSSRAEKVANANIFI